MNGILVIEYTPQYPGCHRICFRTTGEDYCCYEDYSTSVIGEVKITEITLEPFTECLITVPISPGCDTVDMTGYIQPCCTSEDSNDNRVSFETSFIPEPDPECP